MTRDLLERSKKMEENIAYCGLPCHSCPIYLATREQDEEKRYKMRVDIAQQIKEHYNQECKPEDVNDCDGCKAEEERLYSGCRDCQIRKCASERGVENCAHCDEYTCEKLEEFFAKEPISRERLDEIKKSL
jgi:hypothetical protein